MQSNEYNKATPSHLVLHSGAVYRLQEMPSNNLHYTSFESSTQLTSLSKSAISEVEKSTTPEMAAMDVDDSTVICTLAVCCPLERYIAFFYSNGLLQLFDTTRKEVFARM